MHVNLGWGSDLGQCRVVAALADANPLGMKKTHVLALACFALVACKKGDDASNPPESDAEQEFEEAGEEIEEAADQTGDAMEEAADEAEDDIEDAAD